MGGVIFMCDLFNGKTRAKRINNILKRIEAVQGSLFREEIERQVMEKYSTKK
jgi:hypothetical protein